MKTKLTALATTLLLWVVAFPEAAQGQTEDIAQSYVHTVQPEMIAQFEEAVKQHMQWRKQNNDPWEWTWYQVVNGGLGRYLVRSGNHRWVNRTGNVGERMT